MSLRFVLVAALVAGCYAPSASPGAPCSPTGLCPTGQECRSGVCFATGAPHDGDIAVLDDVPIDTRPVDAMGDAASYGPWNPPSELVSLESTGTAESDPSITLDKLTVVIGAQQPDNDGQLFIGTRSALTDSFVLTQLTALNATGFNERSPEISPDGLTIYFTSDRDGDNDVYRSTFNTTWSTPQLVVELSSAGSDEDLAISPDGLTAAVNEDAAPNTIRIHTRANINDAFGAGVVHAELQITADIAAPTITNGGDVIYFHAGAPRQLYMATRQLGGTYSTPMPVAELNVAGVRCAAPFVLQTNDFMMFERSYNIWFATR